MKFGLHSPSWIYPGGPHAIFEGLREKAQWAEAHGFAWLSVMDHLIQIPQHGQPDEPFLEGWTALAALAAVTQRIRLATLVTSTSYRNPALLAKMGASVDIISGGRLTMGIGAGWYEAEYRQYHWPFEPVPERIRRMEEAIRLIKAMWTEPRATFNGKYFQVQDAILEPKPVQKPHPPFMIGGSGEQMTLRAVARAGDACNLFGDPATVRHKLDVLRAHCERVGRDYTTIERTALTGLILGRDEAAARARRAEIDPDGTFRGQPLSVSQAVDLFGEYRQVGVQLMICGIFRNDRETLERLAGDVLPAFQ